MSSEISPAQPIKPAGWYDNGTGALQWWDGYRWTNDFPHPRPQQAAQQIVLNAGPNRHYKTSHGFHLIMSIVTFGLWLPVWAIVGITNAARNP